MLDEKLRENLLSVASPWLNSAFETLSLLVDREIKVEATNASLLSAEETEKLPLEFQIAVCIPMNEEAGTGETCILLSLTDATVLADLLNSGDGTPSEELSDEAKNALQKALDQMAAAGEAGLDQALNATLSIGTPTIVNLADGDDKITSLLSTEAATVECKMSCDDIMDSTFLFIVPIDTLNQISDKLTSDTNESPEERSAAATGTTAEPSAPQPDSAVRMAGEENLNLILDIELSVVARLGEVEMPINEILALGPGSIIEVGRSVDEPVDLLVNEKLVARGEVVVVDEKFGLRVTEIVSPIERVRSLR